MLTQLGLYKLLGENPERAWPVARGTVKPFARLICPSYGYGRERMPANGAAVVAVNHFSEIDPIIVGLNSMRHALLHGEDRAAQGADRRRAPPLDRRLRGAPGRGRSRLVASRAVGPGERPLRRRLHRGTRQRVGHPGPMHAGAAMLAIQEGVPIVPAGLDTFGWSLLELTPLVHRLGRAVRARPAA